MSNKHKIYHAFVLLHYMGATYYNAKYIVVPETEEFRSFHAYGGLSKYLTLWNMIVQCVFFWICLANDLVGTNEVNPKVKPAIRELKDVLFCTIGFPLSAFVSITFWGLYAVDRELVLPKVLDMYFPQWLNHILHTNILIFSMVELISSFRVYPERKNGFMILFLFMLCYLVWTVIIYLKSGQWVYPILTVLNWPQRVGFFAGCLFFIHVFYLAGEMINKLVWGQELKAVTGRQSEGRKKM